MHTRTAAIVGTMLLLALTGCSDSTTTDAKPTATATTTKAKPTPPPAPTAPLPLGTTSTWTGQFEGAPVTGTTTALTYTQPVRGLDIPTDGSGIDNPEWAVLEAKVCITKGANVPTSQAPWALAYPDDTRIEAPFISGSGVPKPEYPTNDKVLRPGDCIRGKLLFTVEKDKRPNRIVYAAGLLAEPLEWTVPAK